MYVCIYIYIYIINIIIEESTHLKKKKSCGYFLDCQDKHVSFIFSIRFVAFRFSTHLLILFFNVSSFSCNFTCLFFYTRFTLKTNVLLYYFRACIYSHLISFYLML